MFETELTKRLGIKYPIIGGTMMHISFPEYAAAVSNAGGLGIMASAIFKSQDELSKAIDRLKELTDKPFAVNINLFPSMAPVDNNLYMDVLQEKKVNIIETSGHFAPIELSERFKAAGMTWIHKCVGVRYAKKAEKLGADFVTVVGYENGGATGKLDIGTLVLIPTVVDAVNLPVIGGGGVSDGRGLLAVLSLGAEGVVIGSRMLATQECPIHDNLKTALVNATELDTMLVMRSVGATHRVWANKAAKRCVDVEDSGGDLEDLIKVAAGTESKRMYDTGDLDAGVMSCGQGIGMACDIPTIKELFDRIINQAGEIIDKITAKD